MSKVRAQKVQERISRLRAFCLREKRVPGYTEMLTLFGYRSKNAVYGFLGKLDQMGYIRKLPDGKIAPTGRLTGSIRLLGTVQAGFPSPAEEELVDVLSLDEFLVRRPEATYMLTISGDSMLDAGIHPGDIVLVERGGITRSGDIVVAQVDGEWTIKYFRKQGREVRLEPANAAYQTITPKHSLLIGGVVKAVIRKYT
jgi:SOS regulatory protein LexA